MNVRPLYSILLVLALQACQHHTDEPVDTTVKQKHNPSVSASYNVQLGLFYLKQGNISRSKRKLLLALEQAPGSPEVNAAMAYFMERTGEVENARMYYQKAMAAAPGRGTQYNNYGTFLCRQGDYQQAETYFLKAVNDIQYEHTSGAYENAGLCALAASQDTKAEQYFMKALGQDPSRIQSLYEWVKLEMKNKRYSQAMAILKKYQITVLQSRDMLPLAIQIAHQSGNIEEEARYRRSLENLGVKQYDNNNSG